MKRFAIISLVLIFAVVISAFSVSAADSYKLIYKDADWQYTDCEGFRVSADFSSGNAVFSGSGDGSYPATQCTYAPDKQVKVKINDYSISYDFTVEAGIAGANAATNISFSFLNADGVTMSFPLANNCLGDVSYDAGSGDLLAGNYKGTIKLSDLVNAKMLFGNTPFDKSYVTKDNELIFSGIQVYSVNGAKITVRKLDVVKNSSKNDKPEESSKAPEESSKAPEESSDESADSSVVIDDSSEEPVESSEASSEDSSEDSSAASAVSNDESKNISSNGSVADNDDGGLGTGAIVAIVIGCIAVIAVIAVVVIKAKKK